MKEQAAILSKLTSGLLVGDVERLQNKSQQNVVSILVLRVVAPFLGNYHYSVLEVTHDIKLYPLNLRDLVTDSPNEKCGSEEEFEKALHKILSSPEVRKVISALLSDIYADADTQVEF